MERLTKGTYLGKNTFELSSGGITISKNIYPEGLKSEWHYHENTYFALTLKGGNIEKRKDATFECKPGMLLFYNHQEPHSNQHYKANSQNFNVELDNNWYKKHDIETSFINGALEIKSTQIKSVFIKIINESFLNDDCSKLGIEGLVLQIFSELKRSQTSVLKKPAPWVAKIKEIMMDEKPENLNLNYLSNLLQMHPVTLSKEFPKYFRCNFSEYMRTIKCQRAFHLLRKKHISIESIAWDSGFSDASHMAKIFKQLYGLSPAQCRKSLCG